MERNSSLKKFNNRKTIISIKKKRQSVKVKRSQNKRKNLKSIVKKQIFKDTLSKRKKCKEQSLKDSKENNHNHIQMIINKFLNLDKNKKNLFLKNLNTKLKFCTPDGKN